MIVIRSVIFIKAPEKMMNLETIPEVSIRVIKYEAISRKSKTRRPRK